MPKSVPPSPWTFMPKTVRWLTMAPAVISMPMTAPIPAMRGMNKNTPARPSQIALPILPTGSMPTVSKMWMLNGSAVSLNRSV